MEGRRRFVYPWQLVFVSLCVSLLVLVPVDGAALLDIDFDGVPEELDNCAEHANPDQRDTDGDRFGNVCDPDFDNNLIVNAADLAYLKSVFFTGDPDADLNGDGVVNAADLAILKEFFFRPPGPSALAP